MLTVDVPGVYPDDVVVGRVRPPVVEHNRLVGTRHLEVAAREASAVSVATHSGSAAAPGVYQRMSSRQSPAKLPTIGTWGAPIDWGTLTCSWRVPGRNSHSESELLSGVYHSTSVVWSPSKFPTSGV